MDIALLLICVILGGLNSVFLKPAQEKCRDIQDTLLFVGCYTFTASILMALVAFINGSFTLPPLGFIAAACLGFIYPMQLMSHMSALKAGPVSLTTLIVNFSLIMPLAYSFCFLNEKITPVRIAGIVLIVLCMILFSNPRFSGEKLSGKWITLAILGLIFNGLLALISKIYAMESNNAYCYSYQFFSYLFSSFFSFLFAFVLRARQKPEERTALSDFFTPAVLKWVPAVGFCNSITNTIVVILATRMDGSIVYPIAQGGGPIITTLISFLVFGEKMNRRKIGAILLGITAIVLLNL